ncbi:hypothetical protein cypCar_00038669 [Cyprinus carpio]|nr:hypothetical protein cypCar_00038669 [Cyprinus carpio]
MKTSHSKINLQLCWSYVGRISAGGQESNFIKYSENQTTTQGTPYDYYSVMHYDKNAFSNGNGNTIITKRPEFQDVIGQRLDFSEYDLIELNTLYKCSSSISFLDHCSFDDESLCQMSVCSTGDYGWQRLNSVSGISVTDHTYLGKEQNGASFFMHFSTEGKNQADTATESASEQIYWRGIGSSAGGHCR